MEKVYAVSLENQVARAEGKKENMFQRYKFSVCVAGTKLSAALALRAKFAC